MTKKTKISRKSGKMQTSTLDTMPMSPPRGGRTIPKGFIPYEGIREEEIEALKLVFPLDGSNPYKDDAYNIKPFMPFSRYEESDHHAHLATLHDEALEVDLKYVAIENLIKQMFSTQHAWTPSTWTTGSRYQYAPPLHATLFQSEPPYERVGKAIRIVKSPPSSEPPYARRGNERRIIESPPKIQLKDLDEETELDSSDTGSAWTVKSARQREKRARERDERSSSRQKAKQRLANSNSPQKLPTQRVQDISLLFDSDAEESEVENEEEVDDDVKEEQEELDDDEKEELDDTINRLEQQEEVYLQEQEETKSEVLNDNDSNHTTSVLGTDNESSRLGSNSIDLEEMIDKRMEEMMNRKMEVRYKDMDKRNTRMQQLEESASKQLKITRQMFTEAESKLLELTSKIDEVTSRIEEATTTIAEADATTTVLADHLEAAQVAMQLINTSRQLTAADATAMRSGAKKLAKRLTDHTDALVQDLQNHKDALAQDLQWTLSQLDPLRIKTSLNEAIVRIKSASDSSILGLSDMARSINKESRKNIIVENRLQSIATKTELATLTKKATDDLVITLQMIEDQSKAALTTIIDGPDFRQIIKTQIRAYIKTFPQEMSDALMKFSIDFFKDNDTIDHYIRGVASSVTDIGDITDKLEREIDGIATKWMNNNVGDITTGNIEREVDRIATEWMHTNVDKATDWTQTNDDKEFRPRGGGPPKTDPTTEEEKSYNEKMGEDDISTGETEEYTGLFSKAHKRFQEEQATRKARQAEEAALAETKRLGHISKSITRFGTMPMHKHCIPVKTMVTMEQAKQLYNEMYDDCLIETYPLTELKYLSPKGSCIPPMHNETDTTIATISHAIMRRLKVIIPITNTVMLDIISPYHEERNGYGALYAIMRRSCAFMKPTTQGWGPTWSKTMTPSAYVVELQASVAEHEMRHNTTYSEVQQSQEMLHQALQSYNTSIATKLSGDFNQWVLAHPKKPLPNTWKTTGLADLFADYPNTSNNKINTLSINAFDGKSKENGYSKEGSQRYSLRNKKQCACCKMAGHSIGDQICRIGAQISHATKFATTNKETYDTNADKYYKSNRPVMINRVMRSLPTYASDETIREECEEWTKDDDEEE